MGLSHVPAHGYLFSSLINRPVHCGRQEEPRNLSDKAENTTKGGFADKKTDAGSHIHIHINTQPLSDASQCLQPSGETHVILYKQPNLLTDIKTHFKGESFRLFT